MIDAALLRPVLGALVLALGVDLAALPEKCVNGCATPVAFAVEVEDATPLPCRASKITSARSRMTRASVF
jgi:hypothetical protein